MADSLWFCDVCGDLNSADVDDDGRCTKCGGDCQYNPSRRAPRLWTDALLTVIDAARKVDVKVIE